MSSNKFKFDFCIKEDKQGGKSLGKFKNIDKKGLERILRKYEL